MKKHILLIIITFSISLYSLSQEKKDLEKPWLKDITEWENDELIAALTFLINENFSVQKTKKDCDNCIAGYTIALQISKPEMFYQFISNTFQKNSSGKTRYMCTTGYTFGATLQLSDNNGDLAGTIILFDTSEENSIERDFMSYSKISQIAVTNFISIKDQTKINITFPIVDLLSPAFSTFYSSMSQEEPEDYVKQHQEQMMPTEKDLHNLIKERILSLVKK